MMIRLNLLAVFSIFLLLFITGLPAGTVQSAGGQETPALSFSPLPPTITPTEIIVPSPTATVQPTPLPMPAQMPAPTWAWNPPGQVTAPILLYHHVADFEEPSRYAVTPANFEAQMKNLKNWGYTSISLSMLIDALENGAPLPPRPVVLTFDDGYYNIYEHAFPVMQRYGFTGCEFIIVNMIDGRGYMGPLEIQELLAAGWEVGSHTYSHTSLNDPQTWLAYEITDSRKALQDMLGTDISFFSFPYGLTSPYVTYLVKETGYKAAVGLGTNFAHTEETRYYLSRIEVRGDYDLEAFASLLPWAGSIAPDLAAARMDVKEELLSGNP